MDIGKLVEEDVRKVFPREDSDFTPWLVENLDLLSDRLGLILVNPVREDSVGSFSCDIVAYDENTQQSVIIENQFGVTNHDHLGKLITYASGKGAGIVIWIAEKFRDEHIKALTWLNERSGADCSFFGVEFRVVKISELSEYSGKKDRGTIKRDEECKNNLVAVDFSVVVKPNMWDSLVKSNLSPRNKRYLNFFSRLVAKYSDKDDKWKFVQAAPRNYLSFSSGFSGIYFAWTFRHGPGFALELYIDRGDGDWNLRVYKELEKRKSEIEGRLEAELLWEELPERRACKISWYKELSSYIDKLSEQEEKELLQWAVDGMLKFKSVMLEELKHILERVSL